jgi:hypothetical protein
MGIHLGKMGKPLPVEPGKNTIKRGKSQFKTGEGGYSALSRFSNPAAGYFL